MNLLALSLTSNSLQDTIEQIKWMITELFISMKEKSRHNIQPIHERSQGLGVLSLSPKRASQGRKLAVGLFSTSSRPKNAVQVRKYLKCIFFKCFKFIVLSLYCF